MRTAKISRKTRETEIKVEINLDAEGTANLKTGFIFFDHMLRSFATHSQINMYIDAKGDLRHHIAEDIAICLGKALRRALDRSSNIQRFGHAIVPMDDSLAFAAVDLIKRPFAQVDLKINDESIEDMPCEDIYHFLETLANSLQATLHVWVQYGTNEHHKIEAAFKALALALKQAIALDPKRTTVPSAKGKM